MGRFKSTLGTIEHMRRLCYLGGHPEPAWLKAWMQMESLNIGMEKPLKRRRLSEVPSIEYPEDRLIESFHARNPEVKLQPIRLNSWEPHPARRYAWQQMALMRQGMSRRKAQAEVQKQYEAEQAKRGGKDEHTALSSVQRAEERVLISAMNKEKEK